MDVTICICQIIFQSLFRQLISFFMQLLAHSRSLHQASYVSKRKKKKIALQNGNRRMVACIPSGSVYFSISRYTAKPWSPPMYPDDSSLYTVESGGGPQYLFQTKKTTQCWNLHEPDLMHLANKTIYVATFHFLILQQCFIPKSVCVCVSQERERWFTMPVFLFFELFFFCGSRGGGVTHLLLQSDFKRHLVSFIFFPQGVMLFFWVFFFRRGGALIRNQL